MNETQRELTIDLIGGQGSSDFPLISQYHIVDLQKLFTFTEMSNHIDHSKLPGYVTSICSANQFTLCKDKDCEEIVYNPRNPSSNPSQTELTLKNYQIDEFQSEF